MNIISFNEEVVQREISSGTSGFLGLPVPIKVVLRDDKIEMSLSKVMKDDLFSLLCIYADNHSKRGHWRTFYKENFNVTMEPGTIFTKDFALAICCCELKWLVKGEIKDIWIKDSQIYIKSWEVQGKMYRYSVVLSETEVTEAMKALLSQILMRPVDCQAVITDDYLCVRFTDRLTTSDLQKICNKIPFPSEDHMAANASEDSDTVPDIGEELVFDLLADYFSVPSVKDMGILNRQVVCLM